MNIRTALPTALSTGALLGIAFAWLNVPPPVALALPPIAPIIPRVEPIVGARWDLPVVRNPSVERLVDLLHLEQADRMTLYLKRSGRYEGMIRTKLRERGMPEDLLYLAMVESAFDPNAVSKASAVGMWQFVAETGRRHGLRVDAWVDERRDPVRSTDAALDYLQVLYERFGAWNLAAAAYNTGENRVARVMRQVTGSERGNENDYWRISGRLPAETRGYVPLMFAAALIGKEPEKYGLEGVERLLPIASERVAVAGGTSLRVVAAAVGVPTGDIQELNPHLIRGMTPPGAPYVVNIPEGRSARFAANMAPRPGTAVAVAPSRVVRAPS